MLWRSALDVNKYFLLLQRFKLSESENVKDFQVANNISITKAQIWSGGRVHLVTLLVLHLYVTNTRPLYPVLIAIRMTPTAASEPRFNRKKTPAAMTSLCRKATFFRKINFLALVWVLFALSTQKTTQGTLETYSQRTIFYNKHCQRHNGPEDWVHITSSNTNLDNILTKHQLQNLNQTPASP